MGVRTWSLALKDYLLARNCLLMVFRNSLLSLLASLSSLALCLPAFWLFHPYTLELFLNRNCRIWCRISFFPQLLFLECFLPAIRLFFVTSHYWLLRLPTRWPWPLNHLICGGSSQVPPNLTNTECPHSGLGVPEELSHRIGKSMHSQVLSVMSHQAIQNS